MSTDQQRDPEASMQGSGAIINRIALWFLTTVAGLLILGGLLTTGASAAPSRYVYEVCDSALPGGGTAGVRFVQNPGMPFDAANTCAQPDGSLRITQTGHLDGAYAMWIVPTGVPPGGEAESMSITGSACNLQTGTVAFVVSNTGWPASACGIDQLHRFNGGGGGYPIWIYLGCDGNHRSGCDAGPTVEAHWIAITEVDQITPTLADLRGSLLAGSVVRGHQTLAVDAHDGGGGLAELSVLVDGLPAAAPKVFDCDVATVENESVVGTVATVAAPCPADGEVEWTLDTQEYPFRNGANRVEVCASDFSTLSAPNIACTPAQTVIVDNSCTATAISGGGALSAQFPTTGSDTTVVPYDRPAEVTGKLSDEGGDPIPGATLCVKMQTIGVDAESSVVGNVKTDANGRYAYKIAPGPNREVVVGYRHDAKQLARSVNYFAHSKPSLRLGPRRVKNGDRIRIWGALPGPSASRRVVVLQASAIGSGRWLTFRRATSDDSGRFHASYRFDGTPHRTTYRIRALVPNQAGYPWVEGHSKPAPVTVTG